MPSRVTWVGNQRRRWGSCTPADGTIRLSDRLRPMPAWVRDYVLLHELVHLVEANHTPRFHALVAAYPDAERAQGYLAGVRRRGPARDPGRSATWTTAPRTRTVRRRDRRTAARLVLVLARHDAANAAPPGVDPAAFAAACLADTYEVAADLVGARSGPRRAEHAGRPALARLPPPRRRRSARRCCDACAEVADEVVLVPADVPDLPGLVLAKQLKVLHRADVAVAPERDGPGCVALGFRLPVAAWVPLADLDLDLDPRSTLAAAAPSAGLVETTPDWHRLRGPAAVHRLDPALEGWEETRALLSRAGR